MNLGKKTTEYLVLAALLIVSCALILSNLGNIYLWGDEAQTALLARTVVSHGLPLSYDGRNYLSQTKGSDFGQDHISRWLPWLQFYIVAAFFALFGESTFTARLPFALFGIATIILTYYFAASFWKNRRAGVVSAGLLIICVPFVLLARQCRYYSADAFFSMLGLFAYVGIMEQKKRSRLLFVLSAVLLFHSYFMECAALLGAVITHATIFRRDKLKTMLVLSAIVALLCVPWMIWFAGLYRQIGTFGSLGLRLTGFASYMMLQIVKHIFPALILVLPLVLFITDRLRRKRKPMEHHVVEGLSLLGLFAFLTVMVLSLTSPGRYFRYLAPLIPVSCMVMGLIIESGMRRHWAVGLVAAGLLAWWWQMPSYLYQITHDYDGPNEGLVRYLQAHAKKDDIVVVNHEDLPIKFYTGLRVICGATGEDLSDVKKADWVVMRQDMVAIDTQSMPYLVTHIPWDDLEEIVLDYPDILFENREDPETHLFRTAEDADLVTIYRRIGE